MAAGRARTAFACDDCGHEAPRWLGRCPGCGAWGTLADAGPAAAGLAEVPPVVRLADLGSAALPRHDTGIGELDRVLGGGLVPGSVVLVGGEPGIGKSTLVLQALGGLCGHGTTLLITGEESPQQVAARARRLGAGAGEVQVLADVRLEGALAAIRAYRPVVCAVDSVQTLFCEAVEGGAGSVGQVREVTAQLVRVAKEEGVAVLLVGQVTKEGGLAGPRALEHLVDTVLTFEGDDLREHRVLRATKNRFGSTNEAGIFEMGPDGLSEVADPSTLYLQEMASGDRVGSCTFPAIEGSRAVLVEVQALVGPTNIVPPRRVAVGVDRTRLAQVIAVLSRHAGLRLGDHDVFVSVAGGARAVDPAADLAIALAVASAHRGAPLAAATAAYGELGLTGAVRPAGHGPRRLGAAAQGGAAVAVAPESARPEEASDSLRPAAVHRIAGVREALEVAFASR